MIFRLIIIIGSLICIDLYFYQAVNTTIKKFRPSVKKKLKLTYLLLSLTCVLFAINYNAIAPDLFSKSVNLYANGVIFVIYASKFLGAIFMLTEDIYRLLGITLIGLKKIFKRKQNDTNNSAKSNGISRRKFVSNAAIFVGAIPFTPMIFGMVKGAFDYTIRRVDLVLPNLPDSFEGATISQISDLHLGSFASSEPVKEIVKLVNEQGSDLVFFTGDLVNYNAKEANPYIGELSKIKSKEGVFSIIGNHDYGEYDPKLANNPKLKAEHMELLEQHHANAGWDLLLNDGRIIKRNNDEIAILGVRNWGSTGRFPRDGDIDLAKSKVTAPVKLLLSHDPSHWDAIIKPQHPDIDAMFSGHTHGAQFGVEIPGFKWSPVQYFYKQWAGLYESGNQKLYVNRGIGFIGYPGRIGIKPEITVFTLRKSPIA